MFAGIGLARSLVLQAVRIEDGGTNWPWDQLDRKTHRDELKSAIVKGQADVPIAGKMLRAIPVGIANLHEVANEQPVLIRRHTRERSSD